MKSCFLFVFFLGIGWGALAQQSKRDSIERLLQKAGPDTVRVRMLVAATDLFWSSDPKKTKQYADEAGKLARQLNDIRGIGKSYVSLGKYYFSQGDNTAYLRCMEDALPYLEQANDQAGIAGVLSNIGLGFHNLGDFSKATTHYFKALRLSEQLGDQDAASRTSNMIGLIFAAQGKYQEALHYYWLSYQKSAAFPRNQAGALINIGNVYQYQKNYDKAIDYINQARTRFVQMNESAGIIMCDNNLGDNYVQLEQYERAENSYRKALTEGEKYGYMSSILSSLLGLGEIRLRTNRASASLEYFERARQLAEQLKHEKRLFAYNGLATAYAKTGRYQQAYDYQTKWTALKDSTFNEESAKKPPGFRPNTRPKRNRPKLNCSKKNRRSPAGSAIPSGPACCLPSSSAP